jgi:hypothetical protein
MVAGELGRLLRGSSFDDQIFHEIALLFVQPRNCEGGHVDFSMEYAGA